LTAVSTLVLALCSSSLAQVQRPIPQAVLDKVVDVEYYGHCTEGYLDNLSLVHCLWGYVPPEGDYIKGPDGSRFNYDVTAEIGDIVYFNLGKSGKSISGEVLRIAILPGGTRYYFIGKLSDFAIPGDSQSKLYNEFGEEIGMLSGPLFETRDLSKFQLRASF
jgi:hypothetical protein